MKVLCLWYATDDEIHSIKEALPPGTEVVAPQGEYFSRFESTFRELEPHARDADAIIGWSLPKGLLEVAGNLKFLGWLHSGCDDLDQRYLSRRGVKLANVRGANAPAVAEQTMSLLLALAKKTLKKHELIVQGRRAFPIFGDEYRSTMLQGRTIGIIGVGSIGGRIARHAKGFEMNVLGVRRNASIPAEYVDEMYGIEDLHSVLAKSDYVVLAMPNTEESNQMIGREELAAMKPTAFLITASRAAVVQEKPLFDALTSGQLRGYAADVWWRYEFGEAFPISWGSRLDIPLLPNVVCSNDHGNADDVLERDIQWGVESLADFLSGRPIARQVDLALGY